MPSPKAVSAVSATMPKGDWSPAPRWTGYYVFLTRACSPLYVYSSAHSSTFPWPISDGTSRTAKSSSTKAHSPHESLFLYLSRIFRSFDHTGPLRSSIISSSAGWVSSTYVLPTTALELARSG